MHAMLALTYKHTGFKIVLTKHVYDKNITVFFPKLNTTFALV